MKMTEALQKFIHDHAGDDLSGLLLNASRYTNIDIKMAVVQIDARVRIKDKLPSWYNYDRLFFPSILATEQCSSEITALYKQRLIQSGDCVCDLTGGLGVDTYFFSQKARCVIYLEKDKEYYEAARYNMDILGASGVCVINGDATEIITNNDSCISEANVFYIDPARRGEGNKRMFAISDCEPDIAKMWSLLRDKQCRIIVKLSPMLDIKKVLSQLPGINEIHVVSVKNECKELLLIADDFSNKSSDTQMVCINYSSNGEEQLFRFSLQEEHSIVFFDYNCLNYEKVFNQTSKHFETVRLVERLGRFLYEPNSSILKSGAYKSIALRFGIEKLNVNSHLYSSDNLISSFPGRIFKIKEIIPFNNRTCKTLAATIPQANITARNFPLTVEELRKRLRISEGGNIYLFATTLPDNKKILIKCCKAL